MTSAVHPTSNGEAHQARPPQPRSQSPPQYSADYKSNDDDDETEPQTETRHTSTAKEQQRHMQPPPAAAAAAAASSLASPSTSSPSPSSASSSAVSTPSHDSSSSSTSLLSPALPQSHEAESLLASSLSSLSLSSSPARASPVSTSASVSTSSTSSSVSSSSSSLSELHKHDLRFLISSSQVGSIIGKAGANVRSVRECSGCYVSILKSEYRDVTERVMEVKGTVEQIPVAVEKIAELLVLAQRERGELREEDTSPLVTLVLLLHRAVVGSIIGKSGCIVKETQQASGVRIQVSNDVLVGSTEKPVSIIGTVSGMREAMRRIVLQVSESEGKGGSKTVLYVPTPASLQLPYPASAAVAYQQAAHHKVLIPSSCAGIIIGRGGETIRAVRAQSGCSISIEDEEGGLGGERVVHIIGSINGIMLAVFFIRGLIEQYQSIAAAAPHPHSPLPPQHLQSYHHHQQQQQQQQQHLQQMQQLQHMQPGGAGPAVGMPVIPPALTLPPPGMTSMPGSMTGVGMSALGPGGTMLHPAHLGGW